MVGAFGGAKTRFLEGRAQARKGTTLLLLWYFVVEGEGGTGGTEVEVVVVVDVSFVEEARGQRRSIRAPFCCCATIARSCARLLGSEGPPRP